MLTFKNLELTDIMAGRTESRKAFLKRFGFNLSNSEEKHVQTEVVTLTDEQTDFLSEYTAWLEEFHKYVKMRNKLPFDLENNKKLMELSAEAEARKPLLEKHMDDILFATAFKKITEDISKEI